MTEWFAGLDIGGTKCAAVIGEVSEASVQIVRKASFATPSTFDDTVKRLMEALEQLWPEDKARPIRAIGISCGGPLNSEAGLVLSPPNLPGWDGVDIVTPFSQRFGVPVGLQNDANACALAEWKWGAGQGCRHMIFLTFGTGMGAGLILNGELYAGANDMAGEVGHIRLEKDGPVGYGKEGSFEGYCSGGGISRLAERMLPLWLNKGTSTNLEPDETGIISAKKVSEAARSGDALAKSIMEVVGRHLGRGMATLVDVLNPERIVIGSIYERQRELLEPFMLEELRKEALAISRRACRIVPAALGDRLGDVASLSIAHHIWMRASLHGSSS